MKQIKSSQDIKKLGSILSVWAHPDDETFTCGGIIATAARNGQTTACITFTKGEAGSQDEERWPMDSLGDIRAHELHCALEILGCTNHHMFGYADGGLADVKNNEPINIIKQYINKYRPDSIFTFGPDGMTGHSDHQTVSGWVSKAVVGMNQPPKVYHAIELRDTYQKYLSKLDERFNIYFNIDEPPLAEVDDCKICYELPKDICDLKCRALSAMPSQTEELMNHLGEDAKKVFSRESFVLAD